MLKPTPQIALQGSFVPPFELPEILGGVFNIYNPDATRKGVMVPEGLVEGK